MSLFKKATKSKLKARVALTGPSGSGKTYTALVLASELGQRVAVIDTERRSASKYVGDVCDFDVVELESYEPRRYVEAIHAAHAEGFDVLVIDSLSHAWFAAGGILDQKDKKGGDGFGVWRTLTPEHNRLIDAILSFSGHVIVTMRSKTEYSVDKDAKTGKTTVQRVGTAPVQRDGVEYEFDVVANLDAEHVMHITKSRCSTLAGRDIREPGREVAEELLAWLDDGEERPPAPARAPTADPSRQPRERQQAQAARERPKAPEASRRLLSECTTEDELLAWARSNASRLVRSPQARSSGYVALLAACGRLEVDSFPVLEAAGLADAGEPPPADTTTVPEAIDDEATEAAS